MKKQLVDLKVDLKFLRYSDLISIIWHITSKEIHSLTCFHSFKFKWLALPRKVPIRLSMEILCSVRHEIIEDKKG